MNITDDIHRQFAEYFDENAIWPYAYLLSQRLTEGNICISMEDMPSNLNTTPYTSSVPPKDLLKLSNLVSKEGVNKTPFILHNDRLYFQRYFKYETSIIQKLKSLIAAEISVADDRMKQLDLKVKLIQSLNANYNINGLINKEQVDWQLVSVLQALLNDTHPFRIRSITELEGIMNGKMDLLFEQEGKFYILDWKSNFLGNSIEFYDEENIKAAMKENNYHLQYLIYTVAARLYLKNRIPDFNYDNHFGGVVYLFLRGLRGKSCTGIFAIKPADSLLDKFQEIIYNN